MMAMNFNLEGASKKIVACKKALKWVRTQERDAASSQPPITQRLQLSEEKQNKTKTKQNKTKTKQKQNKTKDKRSSFSNM